MLVGTEVAVGGGSGVDVQDSGKVGAGAKAMVGVGCGERLQAARLDARRQIAASETNGREHTDRNLPTPFGGGCLLTPSS